MKKNTPKKKILVAPLPKTPISGSSAGKINALVALQNTEGWQIVRTTIMENVKYLERAILEGRDPMTSVALQSDEIESLRSKRAINIEVMETPNTIIERLTTFDMSPENYDPYFSDETGMLGETLRGRKLR